MLSNPRRTVPNVRIMEADTQSLIPANPFRSPQAIHNSGQTSKQNLIVTAIRYLGDPDNQLSSRQVPVRHDARVRVACVCSGSGYRRVLAMVGRRYSVTDFE
ncbi:hypothetical protein U1Q18_050892 [Sarracenia purpurea var. burkii]